MLVNILRLHLLLGALVCADVNDLSNRRIFGGKFVKLGEVPYYAAIAAYRWLGKAIYCGGSIVDERHILTAGHCIIPGEIIMIRVGSIDVDNGGMWHEVEDIVSPYKPETFIKDIALMRIKTPIMFNSFVKPVKLPEFSDATPGLVLTVSGFGLVDANTRSNTLKSVQLEVISEKICQQQWPNNPYNPRVCALGLSKGTGTCSGDSGGPLVDEWTNIIYGVLSYGTEDCSLGASEVYTSVKMWIPWIQKHVRKFSRKSNNPKMVMRRPSSSKQHRHRYNPLVTIPENASQLIDKELKQLVITESGMELPRNLSEMLFPFINNKTKVFAFKNNNRNDYNFALIGYSLRQRPLPTAFPDRNKRELPDEGGYRVGDDYEKPGAYGNHPPKDGVGTGVKGGPYFLEEPERNIADNLPDDLNII